MADTYKFGILMKRNNDKILSISMSRNNFLPTRANAMAILDSTIEYNNINYKVQEVLVTHRFGDRIVDRIGLNIIEEE